MSPKGEPKFEGGDQLHDFRSLVESTVKDSEVLTDWVNPIKPEETMSVLDAIERNEVSLYIGKRPSDRKNDAVNLLVAIYDELKKPTPDQDFIEESVERLKGYV